MRLTRRHFAAALPFSLGLLPAASLAKGSVRMTSAEALSVDERARHERHMARALELAKTTPGPFGAVIVDRGSDATVCEGLNRYAENPIFHGEIDAINNCASLRPKVAWRDLTLYTSAEPCPMCQSAIVWTGISEVVYGTSIEDLARFGVRQIMIDSPTVAAAAPFYDGAIIAGVLKDECDEMYQAWAQSLQT